MQRLYARGSRIIRSNLFIASQSYSILQPKLQTSRQVAIPGNFMKWNLIGSFRTSRFASGFSPLQRKPLDSIIDIERSKHLSQQDLALAWEDYHLGRGYIGVSIKTNLYRLLEQRASQCGYFVVPVRKSNGYITMFAQVQLPYMSFTSLEDYKAKGTEAAPHFTVSFYTEFAESKDMVLVRGDVVFISKLTDEEANWLVETIQSFYLNDARYKLVERFNKHTADFNFKDVLRALDMPSF